MIFVFDIMVFDYILSETWLRKEVNDCEFGFFPNYTNFRCDRCSVIKDDIRGGGVLIAIKHYHGCQLIIPNIITLNNYL